MFTNIIVLINAHNLKLFLFLLQASLNSLLSLSKISFFEAHRTLAATQCVSPDSVMFPDINALIGDWYQSDCKNGLVNGCVGGSYLVFLIDSGAMVNAITPEAYSHLIESKALIFNVDFNPLTELRAYATESPLEVTIRFQAQLTISFLDKTTVDPVQMEEFYVI